MEFAVDGVAAFRYDCALGYFGISAGSVAFRKRCTVSCYGAGVYPSLKDIEVLFPVCTLLNSRSGRGVLTASG